MLFLLAISRRVLEAQKYASMQQFWNLFRDKRVRLGIFPGP
jgi:hypothetical protein